MEQVALDHHVRYDIIACNIFQQSYKHVVGNAVAFPHDP